MVSSCVKLLSLLISLSVNPIDGFDVSDETIRKFEYFWGAEMDRTRSACEDNLPGVYDRYLKYSMDNNYCIITMNRWKELNDAKNVTTKDYGQFFDLHCADIVNAAANCWHNMMLYMETCYGNQTHLADISRYLKFPSYLEYVCFSNEAIFSHFAADRRSIQEVIDEFADKCDVYTMRDENPLRYLFASQQDGRTQICNSYRDYGECNCQIARNKSRKMGKIYEYAFKAIHEVIPCERVSTITQLMDTVKQAIYLKDILWFGAVEPQTIERRATTGISAASHFDVNNVMLLIISVQLLVSLIYK